MADSIQNTFVRVAPDGTVTYDFAGHVHAQGLDLDAGTNATPPDTDKLRWLRTSDGAVVAVDAGFLVAGDARRIDSAGDPFGTPWPAGAEARYEAITSLGGADLDVSVDAAGHAAVTVGASGSDGNVGKTILGSDGFSDYWLHSDTTTGPSNVAPAWTNLTPGNSGINTFRSMQIGKLVFFQLDFIMGTTSAVTGAVSFALPANAVNPFASSVPSMGQVRYRQAATGNQSTGVCVLGPGSGKAQPLSTPISGTDVAVDATHPFAWAANDQLDIKGWYFAS